MTYPIRLLKTDEGYSVWCPALPGCWSQGETEDEARENIRDAIRDYLLATSQLREDDESESILSEVEV